MKPEFHDRRHAGQLLARALHAYAGRPDTIVLGLPRGGVVVAAEVARELRLPLDMLVVRKLGMPYQEEVAFGAIAPGGVCVLNDDLVDMLDIESDTIGSMRRREQLELERREEAYRGRRPAPIIRGKTVLVVDDGIATGATMHAAVVYLHRAEAARVVVAAPVIAREAFRQFKAMVDDVIAVIVADDLEAVGAWYQNFTATTDDEVRRALPHDLESTAT